MRPMGSLRLLLCPGAGSGKKKKIALALALAASSDSSSTRSEQKRFTGCVMTKECPCSPREATLGASPRRRAVAGRGFFHPPAAMEADGGGARRGGARRVGEGTNLCFSFAFSFRVRDVRFAFATLAFARHLLERGEGKAETVRRARGTVSTTARNAKKQKKQTRAEFIAVRTETNHRLRNDQGMPVFTPGSNPRRLPAAACRRGSCEFIDHPTKNSLARAAAVRSGTAKKKLSLLLSRFICITDFETPERNIPYMWPSLKTRPDCGCSTSAFSGDVLREGGERDAYTMRFRVSAFEFVRRGFREKNKREKKTRKKPPKADVARAAPFAPGTRDCFLQSKDGEYIER